MRTLDINIQIETMKHETKAQPVSNLRTSIRYASPDSKLDDVKKLVKVVPAATFRKTVNGIQMTGYNGIIQIEVNHLANRMEVNRVKQEAAELSHTFAAYRLHFFQKPKFNCRNIFSLQRCRVNGNKSCQLIRIKMCIDLSQVSAH